MTNVTAIVKLAIIDSEIQMYHNTRYQLQLRHRVQKGIGGTPEQLKALEDELAKIESALDELEKIKREVGTEAE